MSDSTTSHGVRAPTPVSVLLKSVIGFALAAVVLYVAIFGVQSSVYSNYYVFAAAVVGALIGGLVFKFSHVPSR
jgi:hypothetical protein